ncbi:transposase [Burkholderia ubonensis]|nr:transposase [Burkholderia ubonensis]KVZ69247.1 transposase [Burkholderia ubonensis]KWC06074.1 transposase [Burkholderia ubonensis]
MHRYLYYQCLQLKYSFYLPTYSPELNKIEIVWRQRKYRWRNFVTWTKETIDAELAELLRGYGSAFQTNFS